MIENEANELILKKLESLEKRMNDLDNKIAEVKNADSRSHGELAKDANSREYITSCILERFDFDKCAKVMKFLEWTWAYAENRIPTADEIRDLARTIFAHAWGDLSNQPFDEDGWREGKISTGGFEVCVYEGDESNDNKRFATLKFIVEDMSNE